MVCWYMHCSMQLKQCMCAWQLHNIMTLILIYIHVVVRQMKLVAYNYNTLLQCHLVVSLWLWRHCKLSVVSILLICTASVGSSPHSPFISGLLTSGFTLKTELSTQSAHSYTSRYFDQTSIALQLTIKHRHGIFTSQFNHMQGFIQGGEGGGICPSLKAGRPPPPPPESRHQPYYT